MPTRSASRPSARNSGGRRTRIRTPHDAGAAPPGVTTSVARAGTQVVGFAQVLSDGVVNGYLAQVGVLAPFRRRGIARRLIVAAFEQSGAQRLDLVTDDAQAFSRSFAHQEKPGYRVYPRR